MALFVEPHSPKLFDEENSRDSNASHRDPSAASLQRTKSLSRITMLKELIVALKKPEFSDSRSINDAQSDLLLFSPPKLTRSAFMHALALLKREKVKLLSQASPRSQKSNELEKFGELEVFPGCNPLQLHEEFLLLNDGQKAAIRQMLLANHYSLLVGLPGKHNH